MALLRLIAGLVLALLGAPDGGNATCVAQCHAAGCPTGCLASTNVCYPTLSKNDCYAHDWCWCEDDCPAGMKIDTVVLEHGGKGNDNGWCKCNEFCAWKQGGGGSGDVAKARPSWNGSVCYSAYIVNETTKSKQSIPCDAYLGLYPGGIICSCQKATHFCLPPVSNSSCNYACTTSGVPTAVKNCVPSLFPAQ
jgi:hypothetical protein